MKGNRPRDVCALCDRPIDLTSPGHSGLHLYVGSGMVHGGGRDNIPCHFGCLVFGRRLESGAAEHWQRSLQRFRSDVGFYINGKKV